MSDRQIVEFMNATGATPSVAAQSIARANGDVGAAIVRHLAGQQSQSRPQARTSNLHRAPRHNFATFSDLRNSENREQEFFTGGEKSALAVTNPNERGSSQHGGGSPATQIVDDLINKARVPPSEPQQNSQGSVFGRGGVRLGAEGEAPAETASAATNLDFDDDEEEEGPQEIVHRTLYFWQNGFSIDDGPLYSFDNPRNQEYLRAMSNGRAPLELLGAKPRQLVDVHVVQRRDEEYVKPKTAPSLANAGEGRRLGTGTGVVTEAPTTSTTSTASASTSAQATTEASSSSSLGSTGDAPVQIRLLDGSSRKLRFERTGPVQQLYDYVSQFSTEPFVLQLPFPPKTLSNKEASLEEAGVVNAVVVQRRA